MVDFVAEWQSFYVECIYLAQHDHDKNEFHWRQKAATARAKILMAEVLQ